MAAKIQESGEMYLETILILSKKKSAVRSIDVVEYMGFSKPSVSRAMAKLREDGYILTDPSGFITLTEKGSALATKIYGRHTALTQFLVSIGVGEETAAADACKMEHDISDETFDAMKRHAEKYGK